MAGNRETVSARAGDVGRMVGAPDPAAPGPSGMSRSRGRGNSEGPARRDGIPGRSPETETTRSRVTNFDFVGAGEALGRLGGAPWPRQLHESHEPGDQP